jgi:Spy/CpxP family protein refolding chaperone
MRRQFRWTLAMLFACAVPVVYGAPAVPNANDREGIQKASSQKPQSGSDRRPEHNRVKWWEDATWRAQLGINDRQSGKIREIFEVEMVKLRAMREELNKLEATLGLMVKDDRASLATLTEKWDRVGNLLSEMYKTRQLMIYRIDRELTAAQRVKLQAMFEKLQAERRQEPDRRR